MDKQEFDRLWQEIKQPQELEDRTFLLEKLVDKVEKEGHSFACPECGSEYIRFTYCSIDDFWEDEYGNRYEIWVANWVCDEDDNSPDCEWMSEESLRGYYLEDLARSAI